MKKILLVTGKSFHFSAVLSSMLKKSGFTVTQTADGKSAYGLLQQQDFDLVVTEMMLDYVTGFELINHIKKNDTVPVAVISEVTSEESIRECLAAGADIYIKRPAGAQAILRDLSALVEQYQRKKQAA